MKNDKVNSIKTDADFSVFIQRFMKPIIDKSFPVEYEKKRLPAERKKDSSNPEIKNIIERELIRDNIFVNLGFDIFEYPFVVFYEDEALNEIFKPFKKTDKAIEFSTNLLKNDTHSLLILIMNHTMECRLFTN